MRLFRKILAILVALFFLLACIAVLASPTIEGSGKMLGLLLTAFIGYAVFRLVWPGPKPPARAPGVSEPPYRFAWEYQGNTRSITEADLSSPSGLEGRNAYSNEEVTSNKAIGSVLRRDSRGYEHYDRFTEADWIGFAARHRQTAKEIRSEAGKLFALPEDKVTDAHFSQAKQLAARAKAWCTRFEEEYQNLFFDADRYEKRASSFHDKMVEAADGAEDVLSSIADAIEWRNDPDNGERSDLPRAARHAFHTGARTDAALPRGAFREYRIEYADINGEVTNRDIYVLAIDSDDPDMIRAWCFDREDTRTFRSSRVIEATHLPSGRRVKDLARHYLDHA